MKHILLSALIAALVALGVSNLSKSPQSGDSHKETAYERVMRTGTIRCGYAVTAPWFYKKQDGSYAGVAYDMTQAVADKLQLKIDWVEETGWGVAEQGLLSKRYDMMCGNVCRDPVRSKAGLFTTPFLYAPLYAVVRYDDERFQTTTDMDNPTLKAGVKIGHVFDNLAKESLPKVQRVYANDLGDDSEFYLMLNGRKIDMTFGTQEMVDLFNKANPEQKIRTVGNPIHYCSGAFMVPLGEFDLKAMIDTAIDELSLSGAISKIISKHMPLDSRYIQVPLKSVSKDF